MTKSRFLKTLPNFFPQAKALRSTFDQKFKNPLEGHSDRFVWDYWNVPGQYNLIRTPAEHYFPAKTFSKFTEQLTRYGQENLGCHAISPPWLSYYIEGCEQRLHCDVPHGPFAYVFSLALNPGQDFQGGNTLVMKDQAFDFSKGMNGSRGLESEDLFYSVVPHFNQLLVFDPRFPHGVERVSGTRDPRKSRLVIHGWFTEAQPWADGPLAEDGGFDPIYEILESIPLKVPEISRLKGILVLQLKASVRGQVTGIQVLNNTLFAEGNVEKSAEAAARKITTLIAKAKLSKQKKVSTLTLPLIFS